MAEYFGGILARSCAGGESNDRALRWTSLLAAMPTFDITLHYLVYDAVRRLYVGAGGDLVLDAKNYGRLRIHIPLNDLAAVFDGSLDVAQEMPQGLASLRVADLIGSWFAGPSAELEPIAGGQAVGEGLITEPTIPGLQLFLMAHGYSARDLPLLLDPAADFVATSLLPTAPGAVAVGPPAPGHSVGAEGVEPPTAAL
jgi:hypothetical protein